MPTEKLNPGVVIEKDGRVIKHVKFDDRVIKCTKDGSDIIFDLQVKIRFKRSELHQSPFDPDELYIGDDGAEKIYIPFDEGQIITDINVTGVGVQDPEPGVKNVSIAVNYNFLKSKTRWGKTRWDGSLIQPAK